MHFLAMILAKFLRALGDFGESFYSNNGKEQNKTESKKRNKNSQNWNIPDTI